MNGRLFHLALASLILAASAALAEVSSDPQPPESGVLPGSMSEPPPGPPPTFSAPSPSGEPISQPATPYVPPPASVPAVPGPRETIVISEQPPRWIVSAEALWLERSVGSSIPLGFAALNDPSLGPPGLVVDSLYSDDVLFPLQAGVRFQIAARIDDQKAIQATYWGMQQWSMGRAIYGDPDAQTVLLESRWLQLPLLVGGLDDFLGYTYTSRVDNCEINQRLRLDSYGPFMAANWLWGFRYFRLSDDFGLTGSDLYTGDFESLKYRTNNNLVGMQAGIQWVRGWDRFQLTTEGKIGLLANFYTERGMDSATGPSGTPAGFHPFDVSRSGTDLAALFEVSLLATYRVSPHLWLRAGYQLYCVTGLALAPRQLGDFGHGGAVGLDGLSLGLEAGF